MDDTAASRPLTILVCALGGEGGGVLSEWLYETAVHAGFCAQSTSVPGVAQRTGATTYYIEIHPRPLAEPGPRRPVFSLNPVPGQIDLLVSSELLETARQAGQGLPTADRTVVVTSSARALTVAEKMQLADGRVDDDALLAALQRHARDLQVLDFGALAREAGTVISAVLFGAIAATGVLPMPREAFEATIRRGGLGVEPSLRGFARAFDALAARRAALESVQRAAQAAARGVARGIDRGASSTGVAEPAPRLPDAVREAFPPALHELLALGHARVRDYQDADYAALYVQRLQRVLDAERAADPQGSQGFAVTHETARWLALWMAFDDIVRVAQLKLRASRWDRVRREVAAREDEIVQLYDHFKPGVAEFAALLPPGLAQRLQAWDRARVRAGREPWALPLKLGTHTVTGTLLLRLLAGRTGLRRRGSRFAVEQVLIDRWLAALVRGTREDWSLGHELAQCGRLIKGYGSTNERGKENLLHVVDHLAAQDRPASARAEAVRAARTAALADDAGRAFDQTLRDHGAPARPPREQAIRWFKRRPVAGPGGP